MHRILSLLKDSPDAIFIESASEQLTYRQAIQRIQTTMEMLSVTYAKTIAIFADNQADWIFIDLACQILQICCIPLPLFFSDKQLQHAITSAGIDLIITDQCTRIAQLDGLLHDEVTSINQLHVYKIKHHIKSEKPTATEKITFTSGSTGTPKGVCLTSDQQWRVAWSLVDIVNKKNIRHLCILPLSTLLENIAGVYAPMLAGGTIITASMSELGFNGSTGFTIEKFLQRIQQAQPDTLILLPQLLLALVNAVESGWKPPATLQFIAVGGAKVAPTLIQRAHQCHLPVYEGYGLSECASVVSLNSPDNNKPGSVGKPLPHLQVDIRNNEIFIKDQAFLGYLNEPSSWNQSIVDSGDLGYVDEQGYLHIEGRKKNILISSFGRNINPEWVESELSSHPMIRQCVVFGDARPFCSALIFVAQPDLDDSTVQHWIDQTNSRLPDYAHIKSWSRLQKPLSPKDGLLTDNGRPRRVQIAQYYQAEINKMYSTMEQCA